ncbi:iron-containing alcohol dehydrogenase [Roseimarinus sediminis]|uniref:iron-containing alcohol dehydrogenase n=1 Tax=Roseimarinus sediminis TaxID=1610899 RepID=UPI003D2363A8
MNQINFYHPAKVAIGSGCFNQLPADLHAVACKKVYLLTIPGLSESVNLLSSELQQLEVDLLADTSLSAEPTFSDVESITDKAREFGAEAVVGLGGGSVMDTAKMVAVMLTQQGNPLQYAGIGKVPGRSVWLGCIPTTAGTGSEVSPNAIFLDQADMEKKGVISPFLVPDAAYVDPELTVGVPSAVTAATGLDALTHCIEAYVNKFAHPVTNLYALEGIRLIGRSLVRACNNGNDLEARADMLVGSMYGGICLGPVNTGAVHALSYPLGGKFKVPHGLANALLLPYVMQFNLEAQTEAYAGIAIALGADPDQASQSLAQQSVALVNELIKACKVPSHLSEIGISRNDFDGMADVAMKVDRLLKNNVKPVSREDALKIYADAY